MKTVRHNVFETNSSSCHVVTILSDKEYNDVVDGKAFLTSDGNIETITIENVKECIKGSIESTERSIQYNKERIEKLLPLRGKDTGDWTEDEKKTVCYSFKSMTGTELKDKLNDNIDTFNSYLENLEDDLKRYKEIDAEKMTMLISEAAKYLEQIAEDDDESFSREDFIEQSGTDISEQDYKFVKNYISDFYNLATFGAGYEECGEDERTIDGVTVHVLSYSGYNG